MKNILFASSDLNSLKEISDIFSVKDKYKVFFATSGKEVCERVKNDFFTLVVSDEKLEDCTGIELAEDVIKINAMTNTAVVSTLSDSDFHEASEGLGVLMKLPKNPAKENGIELEEYLNKILGL